MDTIHTATNIQVGVIERSGEFCVHFNLHELRKITHLVLS